MRRAVIFGILTMQFAVMTEAWAQAGSQCNAALTVTGRNELLRVSESDRRAYFYRQVCQSQATSAGFSFESVKVALGLTYSSQQQYCEAERSQWENYQFDYLQTSTVVEKALDSWLACLKLTRSGIIMTPQLEPTRLILDLERGGRARGVVRGVVATAGTVCKGHLPNRNGGATTSQVLSDSINFQLPTDETWTVICDRTALPSAVQPDAVVYPATTITLDTTEGAFSMTLEQSPLATERWANEISSTLAALRTDLTAHGALLSALQASKLSSAQLSNNHEVTWHYINDWVECPEGWVLYRVGTGSQYFNGEIRGSCRQLVPIKP